MILSGRNFSAISRASLRIARRGTPGLRGREAGGVSDRLRAMRIGYPIRAMRATRRGESWAPSASRFGGLAEHGIDLGPELMSLLAFRIGELSRRVRSRTHARSGLPSHSLV